MTDTMRVLALSPIPEEGAGCRFRIAQFIPYLRSVGIDVTLRSLFTADFFHLVYRHGHYLEKASRFATLAVKHLASLRDLDRFDAILLYREMFPIGPAVVERLMARRQRPPIVFDFDDAIFLPNVSEANQAILALKSPGKVATIVRHADHVIAGNAYLADYARRFNPAVTVIPTCVDTEKFVPAVQPTVRNGGGPEPIVGWIGSPTTAPYVRALIPALQQVAASHQFVLRISGAGEPFNVAGISVEQPGWTINSEVSLFNTCDIGIYPLTDNEWSKGKCGFKAIEFMACGVPVVASAVGVNREIIQDGVNGFLASTTDEWVDKLTCLLRDPDRRQRFGAAGRRTIEERYSLRVHGPTVAQTLRQAAASRRTVTV
jgi:glycosyltransferase involved in cell wall biosynthesis